MGDAASVTPIADRAGVPKVIVKIGPASRSMDLAEAQGMAEGLIKAIETAKNLAETHAAEVPA